MSKRIAWAPLIISLILIFGLTVQDCKQSADLTVTTQTVIDHVATDYVADKSQNVSHWWDDFKFVRRLAHTAEYLFLGLSAVYPLKKWWKAGAFCLAVSFIDEIIKGILPGREFDLIDMGFDLAGYLFGIAIMVVILRIQKKKKCP